MSDRTTGNQDAKLEQARRAVQPLIDVFEDSACITLLADMPGVSKDTLDVHLDGETLIIEGRVETPVPEGLEPIYAEVSIPLFRRTFTLSRELDAGKIEANLKDGVLTVRIPKREHAQPRRIEVALR